MALRTKKVYFPKLQENASAKMHPFLAESPTLLPTIGSTHLARAVAKQECQEQEKH